MRFSASKEYSMGERSRAKFGVRMPKRRVPTSQVAVRPPEQVGILDEATDVAREVGAVVTFSFRRTYMTLDRRQHNGR